MKNLQNLKGAHTLSKNEQQSINGGLGDPCGRLGGTLMFGMSETTCAASGGIWRGGKCWMCFE